MKQKADEEKVTITCHGCGEEIEIPKDNECYVCGNTIRFSNCSMPCGARYTLNGTTVAN